MDVGRLGVDGRQEAIGVKRPDISARGARQPRKRGAAGVAVLITDPAVKLPVARDRRAGIGPEAVLLDRGIAESAGDRAGGDARIVIGAIGRLALQILAGDGEESVLAKAESLPGAGSDSGFAGGTAIAASRLDVGIVEAVFDGSAAARACLTQAHIDDAGNRIRSILRRGAVAQHLDLVERYRRDGVEIGRGGTPPDP